MNFIKLNADNDLTTEKRGFIAVFHGKMIDEIYEFMEKR